MRWLRNWNHRDQTDALNVFWDEVVQRSPATPLSRDPVPAELSAIVRQLHAEQDARQQRSQEGSESPAEIEQEEVRQALREEVQRLPEKYRLPLTLCYFDGRTHAEAAQAIGLPRGSVAKRVGESLERLRERLLERGLSLGGAKPLPELFAATQLKFEFGPAIMQGLMNEVQGELKRLPA